MRNRYRHIPLVFLFLLALFPLSSSAMSCDKFDKQVHKINVYGGTQYVFDFHKCGIEDDDFDSIAAVISKEFYNKKAPINTIDLSDNWLSNKSADKIAVWLSSLKRVSYRNGWNNSFTVKLNNNNFGNSSAKIVSAITSMQSPEYQDYYPTLDLSTNHITDAGISEIAKYVSERHVHLSLILKDNYITAKGALILATMQSAPFGLALDLSYNMLGDDGAIAFANNISRNLRNLKLEGNQINDAGAKILASARYPLRLNLWIDYNNISNQVMQQLDSNNYIILKHDE